jgi:hypothetical protein
MTTQRVRDVDNACELLRSKYLPAASVFCLQRCLGPKTKTELNRFFKNLQFDRRVTCLSKAARDELKRNIQEVCTQNTRVETLLSKLLRITLVIFPTMANSCCGLIYISFRGWAPLMLWDSRYCARNFTPLGGYLQVQKLNLAPAAAWKKFLGGMVEGRSNGLRKWFSDHCGGLQALPALEAVMTDKHLIQVKPENLTTTCKKLKRRIKQ